MSQQQHTHFGYQNVPLYEKAQRVGAVFDSVAPKYDLMNDLMSLGVHRLWKRFAIELAAVRPGDQVLDLAAGTGDLSLQLAQRVGAAGTVIASDINAAMLSEGRNRLIDQGQTSIHYAQANAETLPFASNQFNCVTMAFGLRNVTHKEQTLAEMLRVLRPGGRAIILEFSHPIAPGLKPFYDAYSFTLLPLLGQLIVNDAASYRYLAESIRMHPDQTSLKQMMEIAGFERCEYFNLSAGIVAVHRGYKL